MENPERPGTPPGMTEADVAERSELAGYLGKEIWPASKSEILAHAESEHAPDEVMARLRQLPDEQFTNAAHMWSALGGSNEERRT